jgi:FAD:protein FMN transferase
MHSSDSSITLVGMDLPVIYIQLVSTCFKKSDRRWLVLVRSFHRIAAIFAITAAAHCLHAQTTSIHVFQYENVLGTSLEMKLRTRDDAVAKLAKAAALAEVDRENAILSTWQDTSEFSRWTRTHGTAEHVSPELIEVLGLFDAWREQTDGALDASAETAVRVWKEAESKQIEPTSAQLAQAVRTMQRPHWTLDRAAGKATHLDDAPIALNSFVKSYIGKRAANAALAAGATGVLLNLGGDIVLRGALTERVAIADPTADAENDKPIAIIRLANRTIATSGAYRRGVDIHGQHFSHIIDPRTGLPAENILSSTVIAPDASEAGALATAFSVMSPAQSQELAARLRGVDYLIVTATGETIASPGWSKLESHLQPASFALSLARPVATVAKLDLVITLELARIDDPRYRRPYVSVWVEDKNHVAVRTLALWYRKPRYLPELKNWYRNASSGGNDPSMSVSSATRPPGKYPLRWDGNDANGKPVHPGRYTICIEAAREHGTYQIMRQEIDFDGRTPRQISIPGNTEIAGATLDYGEHNQ